MDLKDIKAIIDLMKKNSISEFELERQDFKIKLKRTNGQTVEEGQPGPIYLPASVANAPAPQAVHPAVPGSCLLAQSLEVRDASVPKALPRENPDLDLRLILRIEW